MANIALGTSRARLNELKGERAKAIAAAEAALTAKNITEYDAQMAKAKGMNSEIDQLSEMVKEYDRYDISHAPIGNPTDSYEAKHMEEMLKAKERVGFKLDSIMPMLRPLDAAYNRPQNALLFSGDLTNPERINPVINPSVNSEYSSIVDQVSVVTLPGFTEYAESYEKEIGTATSGKPEIVAGKTPASADPNRGIAEDSFRIAKCHAYNVNITKYADKAIASLTGTPYLSRIASLASIAIRKKQADLIVNGDGLSSSIAMYGIKNAKNTKGENISRAGSVTAINKAALRNIAMTYGGNESIMGGARLYLSKDNLIAFGDITKDDSGEDFYEISPNGNVGTIKTRGVTVPYTLTAAAGANSLLFGDPSQYVMPIFSDLTIRLDESYKAGERLLTILGDIMLSGNLVADQAFDIHTLA